MTSVLLLSGGIDSLVVLAMEYAAGPVPLCLSVDYGQRHWRELDAAERIARHYGATLREVAFPRGLLAGSALTGQGEVPRARHDDPVQAATVVPGRNLLLISVAGAFAAQHGCDRVLIGAHAGDAAIYPDCRPEFIEAASATLRHGCGVSVVAPLLDMDKAGVVARGKVLGAPLELAWSCYQGSVEPCGECGACRERREAGA